MPRNHSRLIDFIRILMSCGLGFGMAFAAVGQTAGSDAYLLESTQRWLESAVLGGRPSGAVALRMEVIVGALDSRLRLAPCAHVEPYMPAGTRLWGRTRMGLRCTEGVSKWNIFLPVTVKAHGPALIIKGNINSGAPLSLDDVMEAEVDWAEDPSAVVTDATSWIGQIASRPLTTGQALRQGMFRPPQVFQAGAQIRVLAQGIGFQITSDGQALSAGIVGQPVRVKMDNGRIMTGVVLDPRTVKIDI
jgi:flagellar basal body P-ring formation protein FlgA